MPRASTTNMCKVSRLILEKNFEKTQIEAASFKTQIVKLSLVNMELQAWS